MPTIFIDFDRTLFDTDAWKESIARVLSKRFGFSRELYLESYEAHRDRHGKNVIYHPKNHARFLKETRDINLNENDFANAWLAEADTCAPFIFPDALQFLETLNRHSFQKILLTQGNNDVQQQKLRSTDVARHFDRVIITQRDKRDEIATFLPTEHRVFFLNDHERENQEVATTFPHISVIPFRHRQTGGNQTFTDVLRFIQERL